MHVHEKRVDLSTLVDLCRNVHVRFHDLTLSLREREGWSDLDSSSSIVAECGRSRSCSLEDAALQDRDACLSSLTLKSAFVHLRQPGETPNRMLTGLNSMLVDISSKFRLAHSRSEVKPNSSKLVDYF